MSQAAKPFYFPIIKTHKDHIEHLDVVVEAKIDDTMYFKLTFVWPGERMPCCLFHCAYSIFRKLKYGRTSDRESMYVAVKNGRIEQISSFNFSERMQSNRKWSWNKTWPPPHEYFKYSIDELEKDENGRPIIYIATWNHIFSKSVYNPEDYVNVEYRRSAWQPRKNKTTVVFFVKIVLPKYKWNNTPICTTTWGRNPCWRVNPLCVLSSTKSTRPWWWTLPVKVWGQHSTFCNRSTWPFDSCLDDARGRMRVHLDPTDPNHGKSVLKMSNMFSPTPLSISPTRVDHVTTFKLAQPCKLHFKCGVNFIMPLQVDAAVNCHRESWAPSGSSTRHPTPVRFMDDPFACRPSHPARQRSDLTTRGMNVTCPFPNCHPKWIMFPIKRKCTATTMGVSWSQTGDPNRFLWINASPTVDVKTVVTQTNGVECLHRICIAHSRAHSAVPNWNLERWLRSSQINKNLIF